MNGQQSTEIERRCAKCGVEVLECMGFVLARDQTAMLNGERIIARELCGKCIIWWSTRVVGDELVDTTQEEREAMIMSFEPPRFQPDGSRRRA